VQSRKPVQPLAEGKMLCRLYLLLHKGVQVLPLLSRPQLSGWV
jgi:hypothetical protein